MARQSPRDPLSRSEQNAAAVLLTRLLVALLQNAARNPRLLLWLLVAVAVVLLTPLGWYLVQPGTRKADMRAEFSAYWHQPTPAPAAANNGGGNGGKEHFHVARQPVRFAEVLGDFWTLYVHPGGSLVPTHATLDDSAPVFGGEPRRAGFPLEIRTLYNTAYTVGYCEALADPVWSAYRVFRLPPDPAKPPRRPGSFFLDGRTQARVEPGDFTGSGYDRGHMTPNYAIASHYSHQAQEETFLLSNICPQRHKLNAGLWAELEARVADNYPTRFGQVWVLVGPVFGPLDRLEKLRDKIAIPRAFYMIIAQKHECGVRAEAFVVDQEVKSHGSFAPFLTTVGDVEQQTGLRFFPDLENAVHDRVASQRPASPW